SVSDLLLGTFYLFGTWHLKLGTLASGGSRSSLREDARPQAHTCSSGTSRLFDESLHENGALDVVILPRLEADGDRAIDHVERPVALDLACVGVQLLADQSARFDLEVADRHPHRIDVRTGRDRVRKPLQRLMAEVRMARRVVVCRRV